MPPTLVIPPTPVLEWVVRHEKDFQPPIGNKLMHRGRCLSVMFVGGPNSRTDFHSSEGSEVFVQLRGAAEVVTIQRGKRKVVRIPQGSVFGLPSRVPHSPQRKADTVGLVLERQRTPGQEFDRMTWFTDFEACDVVEWERYFPCEDLGKDLKPVAEEYAARKREAAAAGTALRPPPASAQPCAPHAAWPLDVPDPRPLLKVMREAVDRRAAVAVLERNPDAGFTAVVDASARSTIPRGDAEVFVMQLEGSCSLRDGSSTSTSTSASVSGAELAALPRGACVVVDVSSGALDMVRASPDSVSLVVAVRRPFHVAHDRDRGQRGSATATGSGDDASSRL